MHEMSLDHFLYALQNEYIYAGDIVIQKCKSMSNKSLDPEENSGTGDSERSYHIIKSAAGLENGSFHSPVQLRISEFSLSLQARFTTTGPHSFLIIDSTQKYQRAGLQLEISFMDFKTGEGFIRLKDKLVMKIPEQKTMTERALQPGARSSFMTRLRDWLFSRKGYRLSLTKQQAELLHDFY